MTISSINGVALSTLSHIDGIAKSSLSAINGQSLPASATEFISSYSGTSLRNNSDKVLGFRFTPGSDLSCVRLSRWKVAGNTGTHNVQIRRNSDDVQMATANIDLTLGSAASFVSVAVTPVTLVSGVAYNIASQEVNGGDQFYDALLNFNTYTDTGAATVNGSVFADAFGSAWSLDLGGAGWIYVPVSFGYA